MPKKNLPEKIYQLHISLKYIKPEIWRRFLVTDEVTFEKLHKIIQIVMGWEDYHLHEFSVGSRKFGMPDEEWDFYEAENEKKVRLNELNMAENQKFGYLYDFGDSWEHEIKIEKLISIESGVKYPKCLAGERACPPEDCGAFPGYDQMFELHRLPPDELDEDDAERIQWLGEDHDFEYFSVDEVNAILWKKFAR